MYRILIVDDEQIERDGIKFLIEKYNLELETAEAENGEEALDYLKNNPVDILFTDIKMPFMDGLTLASKARMMDPDIHIIIFSAYGEFDYARQAINLQAARYILKPISLEEFRSVFSNVIVQCWKKKREKAQRSRILSLCTKGLQYKSLYGSTDSRQLQEIMQRGIETLEGKNQVEDREPGKKVIQDIISLIQGHYGEDISLEWVAEKVYLSPSYLSYLFKKEMKVSLVKYVSACRLQKARDLLQNTHMKVVDIGEQVGYTNTSYFCAVFKNYYGVSPVKYRDSE